MNNEKYNQIIDEVYMAYLSHTILGVKNGFDKIKDYMDGCLVEFDGEYEHFSNPSFQYGYRPHTNEEFINKCKTNPEFSEKWGLKIEERELSYNERFRIAYKDLELRKKLESESKMLHFPDGHNKVMDESNIPTKLITVTYNDETVEIYEYLQRVSLDQDQSS